MPQTTKTIKTHKLERVATIVAIRAEGEGDDEIRVADLSFSSEEPYGRYFGQEVLGHDAAEVRMDFMASGNAPLLLDHDPTKQIGVVEKADIGSDRKGRAVVRFGKSALADEVFNDVNDGIRKNISVGYRVHEMETIDAIEGEDAFRVVDWSPLEISIVSIPADPTVGMGRSDDGEQFDTIIRNSKAQEPKIMPQENKTPEVTVTQHEAPAIDADKVRAEVLKGERQRIDDINALASQHGLGKQAEQSIRAGHTIEQFRGIALDHIGEATPLEKPQAELDLSKDEVKNYSILKALRAQVLGNWDGARFEKECSDEISKRLDKDAQGFYLPTDVRWETAKRDLTVGTASAGGNLVGTDHMGSSYIEALRNRLVLRAMGARILSGLRGDIAIPGADATTTHYWVDENGAPTEGAPTFRQVTMTPKTIAGYVDLSRKLMQQSDPSVEALIRDDLVRGAAVAIDTVGINGGGTNEPTGILQTAGIGSVAIGTNGGAPTWESIVNLQREVEIDNADTGALGYLTNPKVKAKMATTVKVASTDSGMLLEDPYNSLYGAPLNITNSVPSDLTKGSGTALSPMIFGNFNDVIIGEWGVLDILVNPYTLSTSGATRITVFQDVDVAVRRAQSFSAVTDYTTT